MMLQDASYTVNLTNVGVQTTSPSVFCNGTDLAPYSVLFGSNALKLNVTDGSTIALAEPTDPTAQLKLWGVFALSLTEVSGLMGWIVLCQPGLGECTASGGVAPALSTSLHV